MISKNGDLIRRMKIFVAFPDFWELEHGKSYMPTYETRILKGRNHGFLKFSSSINSLITGKDGDITNKNGNIWWFREKKMVAGVGTVTNEDGEMNHQVSDYYNNGSRMQQASTEQRWGHLLTNKGGDAIPRIMGIQTQTNKDGVRNVVDLGPSWGSEANSHIFKTSPRAFDLTTIYETRPSSAPFLLKEKPRMESMSRHWYIAPGMRCYAFRWESTSRSLEAAVRCGEKW